jgi:hypothetical protein
MSFYLFIAFGFFTFAMSGLRQTIAIGLTLLCFVFAKNRKPLLYTLFLIAAFLFHYSAIIFAPAYFLERIELNKRNVIVSSIVALLIFSFSSVIFIFANSYARISYEEMETGGNLMFLFYILLLILGFTQKKNLLAIDSKNSCLYYYMITTIVLFPLCKFHPALFRLTFFYSIIVFIVYVPNVLFSVKNSVVRFSFTFIICIIATYFLTYKVLLPMNKLLPYYFFWE